MSHTLQLEIPEPLYSALAERAQAAGEPLETIATQWLTAMAEQAALDPLEEFIGAFDSGGSDWVERHDHYLGRDALPRAEDSE